MVKDCSSCNGSCCKYVAMEIDCPDEMNDFENIRWYVAHKNIRVFVEEDDCWNIEFATPCEYLDEQNRCSIHEDFVKDASIKRPKICGEFSAEECPHHNKYDEKYAFENMEDVDKYIAEVFLKGKHVVQSEEEDEE